MKMSREFQAELRHKYWLVGFGNTQRVTLTPKLAVEMAVKDWRGMLTVRIIETMKSGNEIVRYGFDSSLPFAAVLYRLSHLQPRKWTLDATYQAIGEYNASDSMGVLPC